MTTYSVQYTMYFFDEPNVESYFEVQAESLEQAWEVVLRDYPEYCVDDVYERVEQLLLKYNNASALPKVLDTGNGQCIMDPVE